MQIGGGGGLGRGQGGVEQRRLDGEAPGRYLGRVEVRGMR